MPQETSANLPNGSGAAAILAAGLGCFAIGVIAVLADKTPAVKRALVFYKPTGALSGVTTTAILIWLLAASPDVHRYGARCCDRSAGSREQQHSNEIKPQELSRRPPWLP